MSTSSAAGMKSTARRIAAGCTNREIANRLVTTENTIIINQAEKVLAVPKLAVKQRGGKQYVRVLGENKQPQEKEITTGLSDNMNTEVKSGLGEGENVIISEAAAGETSDSVGRGMGRPPM